MRRFEPGEAIALREIWDGRVWSARPSTVVEDLAEQTTLFTPAGIAWFATSNDGRRLRVPQSGFELVEQRWDEAHVLSIAWPGRWAAALLLARLDWSGARWYVNVEDPLRRTPVGFDTLDRQLDALVEPDGTWRWKDEDEFEEAIRRGVTPPEDAPRLRSEAEALVERIVERRPPFDREWMAWRPDPAWPPPILPSGWDRP